MQGKTNGMGIAARQIFTMRLKVATELWRWKVRGVPLFSLPWYFLWLHGNLGQPSVTFEAWRCAAEIAGGLGKNPFLGPNPFFFLGAISR